MPYNVHNYNEQRFNINGVFHVSSLSELVIGSDATQVADTIKLLGDLLTVADNTATFAAQSFLVDTLFVEAVLQLQVSNKALNDAVRLADWLSIERNPASDNWGD